MQAVGFAPLGTVLPTGLVGAGATSGYRAAKGVQSVGLNTTFNLEQVYELGQLSLYENVELIPDIEVTIEKVLDGYALLAHLCTPTATASSLAGRYNDNKCQVALAYYDGSLDYASGVPLSTVVMSGMYLSALSYNIPTEGTMRESITLVGNDKVWNFTPSGVWSTGTLFTGSESPVSPYGVLRRQNIVMVSSLWPKEIYGIDAGGINQPNGVSGYTVHLQNATVSCNLGRTSLFELGTKAPYFRYANFPAEVTFSVTVTTNEHGDAVNAAATGSNLANQTIKMYLDDGISIDLGTKNKLKSINKSGGDTGGGNVTAVFTYSTFNDLRILMPTKDPAALAS